MPNDPTPKSFPGVMVSSTFTDLQEHRATLIKALVAEDLHPVAMEHDAAKPMDLLTSSLEMVRKASAYIGVISHKYGQVPPSSNPQQLSITELEFNEAQRIGLPIILFIMGPDFAVKPSEIERDPAKLAKLDAFRERAKEMSSDNKNHRVYATFNSLEEFKTQAPRSISALRRHLGDGQKPQAVKTDTLDLIPSPPTLYAEPHYIGSHHFVGRRAELEKLDDWANAADPHPILLFDAIGGSGKSMLTWHWTAQANPRTDWAGIFWYSFYERGVQMADFCRRALAYMTRQPLEIFKETKTPELSKQLLNHLHAAPWLIVLDGLERVLVAYNRVDAAQVSDEEVDNPIDKIVQRDPCSAIRPEDDDLLRQLAAAKPSKILISTRLVPKVLLNAATQAIPGIRRVELGGLRPPDAEALFRSCGVTGDSDAIQNYLRTNCDCHPLTTGALAGLIVHGYLNDPGNFDAWVKDAEDPRGGARLNLEDLDLIQRRNHILTVAFDALSPESRQLLSVMSLLSEAVDFATLKALSANCHRVLDLRDRGLIQYNEQNKRYDLHPVVRRIASGRLSKEERNANGQRVVDHFSARPHNPYDQATSIEELQDGLHVVRTLVAMERLGEARGTILAMSDALLFNLEAHPVMLSLLKPFLGQGWDQLSAFDDEHAGLSTGACIALWGHGYNREALDAGTVVLSEHLRSKNWAYMRSALSNLSTLLERRNHLAQADRSSQYAFDLASQLEETKYTFQALLGQFVIASLMGSYDKAIKIWGTLDPMGRSWPRSLYRSGNAEREYAEFCLQRGILSEEDLARAETLAREGISRLDLRRLQALRGAWHLDQRRWDLAVHSINEAVTMARAAGIADAPSETQLALVRFHLGQLPNYRREAEHLASLTDPYHRGLAELWFAIGNNEQAKKHALAAYKWAWADGEPYVRRWELNKATELLSRLNVPIPQLPAFDPDKDGKFPLEDEVNAAITELKAEKEAKNKQHGEAADPA